MTNNLDTKVIGKLAEILDKNNLTEIEYEDEGCRISLSRTVQGAIATVAAPLPVPPPPPGPHPLPPQAPAAVAPAPVPAPTEDYSNNPNAIKSPMVGVVYLSADPNTPNYVKPGDSVKEGDIVTITNAWETLEYEVAGHIVIEPDDLNAIRIIPGADMVTLVTCHPYGSNSQRYVVYCKRKDSTAVVILPEGEAYVTSNEQIEQEDFVTMIGNGGIVIMGIVVVILVVRLCRKQ